MSLKHIFIFIASFLTLISCTSEEEQTTQQFIDHAKNLNIDAIKDMSTEDTQFYIKMTLESIVSFGDDTSKEQLKKIAATLECTGENNQRQCSYIDDSGNKHFFDIELVKEFDENGEEKLLVDINKKFFWGEE